jgi:ketosteroid isomerase-like protein
MPNERKFAHRQNKEPERIHTVMRVSVPQGEYMTSIRGIAILCIAAFVSCTAARAEDPLDEVRQTLQNYEQAWSRHDAHAVADFYFEPAMRVSKGGPVIRATRADQETFFEGYLRAIVARGYERSEWESLDARLLDAQTAIASGIAVRRRADGSTLERVAVTYELWHTDNGWEIFLSATHAPETVLQFR